MKRKGRRFTFAGSFLFFLIFPVLTVFSKLPVRAETGDLTATTEDVISRELYHHHSEKCSETLTYVCDGDPVKIFTGYENGKKLYRVECSHKDTVKKVNQSGSVTADMMHKGTARGGMTSEEADRFIEENWSQGRHTLTLTGLHCGLKDGDVIGGVSIIHNKELDRLNLRLDGNGIVKINASFDKGTFLRDSNYGRGGGDLYQRYDANGKYTGTYTYMDCESEKEYTETMEYTVTHLPITVKYSVDGVIRDDMTRVMYYGGALPATSKPAKTGYSFQGYYLDEVMYYDREGKAVNGADTRFLDMSVTFTAKWLAEEYSLEYAGKKIKVTYDSAYSGIEPDPSRAPEGYELDRFCIGDIEPFNTDGSPKNSRWIWAVGTQGVHTVTEVWKARHFKLRYGDPAANGGTAPEAGVVEYDAAYPDISPGDWDRPKGYELEGIYYGELKLYGEKGEALNRIWKWVPASGDTIELENKWKAKVYTIYHGPAGRDGKPAWSATVEYGTVYPGVKIYTGENRKGYRIDGLYIGEEKIFDDKDEPVGIWIWDFEERELYPEVRWVPKTAKLRFPGSDDETEIVYDSDYPPIRVPDPRPGMIFEGYFLDDDQVYDEEGKPTGKWRWDINEGEELELKERWTPKKYSIFFGPDRDGDGIGDLFITVTYGEPYPAITPPVYDDGEVFDGFYCDGELVWDRNGNPTGVWRWDPEEHPLETRSHTEKPSKDQDPGPEPSDSPDKTPDKSPDKSPDQSPDRGDDTDKSSDQDNDSENGNDTDKDRDKDPDKDKDKDTDKVEDKDKDEEGDDTPDKEKNDDDDKGDPAGKKKKRKNDTEGMTDTGGQSGTDGSGDGGSGPSGQDTGSGNEKDQSDSGSGTVQPAGGDTGAGDGKGGGTGKKDTRGKRKSSGGSNASENTETDTGTGGSETGELIQSSENGDTAVVNTVLSDLMVKNTDSDRLKDLLREKAEKAVPETAEAEASKAVWKEKAARVAKAGAVTAGTAAGIAAIYAGLVYLFGMAEIYSINADGSRKRLGKLAINEEGGGFMVNISRSILNECETGRLGMRLSALFVSRNRNKEMIINNDGRKQQEYIRRDIVVAV